MGLFIHTHKREVWRRQGWGHWRGRTRHWILLCRRVKSCNTHQNSSRGLSIEANDGTLKIPGFSHGGTKLDLSTLALARFKYVYCSVKFCTKRSNRQSGGIAWHGKEAKQDLWQLKKGKRQIGRKKGRMLFAFVLLLFALNVPSSSLLCLQVQEFP